MNWCLLKELINIAPKRISNNKPAPIAQSPHYSNSNNKLNGSDSKNHSSESKYKSPEVAKSRLQDQKQNGSNDQYGTLMPDQIKNMNLKNDSTLKSNTTRKKFLETISKNLIN